MNMQLFASFVNRADYGNYLGSIIFGTFVHCVTFAVQCVTLISVVLPKHFSVITRDIICLFLS